MKKLFVLVFILLPLIHFSQPEKVYSALGVKSGVNFSSVAFTQSTGLFSPVETTILPRFTGGLAFKHISENKPYLGVQLEVNFSQRGWQETSDSVKNFYSRKLNYIEVPVMGHVEIFGKRKVNVLINFGLNVSYKLSEKEKLKDAPITRTYYNKPTHRDIDYGILIGTGVNYNLESSSLQLEARLYRGLSDLFVANEEVSVSQNQIIGVSLTYFFWMKKY